MSGSYVIFILVVLSNHYTNRYCDCFRLTIYCKDTCRCKECANLVRIFVSLFYCCMSMEHVFVPSVVKILPCFSHPTLRNHSSYSFQTVFLTGIESSGATSSHCLHCGQKPRSFQVSTMSLFCLYFYFLLAFLCLSSHVVDLNLASCPFLLVFYHISHYTNVGTHNAILFHTQLDHV